MIARITSLSAPPTVGRWYLVPTVMYPWLTLDPAQSWPVFLPWDEDAEHLKFEWMHFRVDPRFLSARWWARAKTAGNWYGGRGGDERAFAHCQGVPLGRRRQDWQTSIPPKVIWRRMRCARAAIPYMFGHRPSIKDLRDHFAGRICSRALTGWVCPHNHFPLGSIAPIDGVITCPKHGLRVRASDGVVLPAFER